MAGAPALVPPTPMAGATYAFRLIKSYPHFTDTSIKRHKSLKGSVYTERNKYCPKLKREAVLLAQQPKDKAFKVRGSSLDEELARFKCKLAKVR